MVRLDGTSSTRYARGERKGGRLGVYRGSEVDRRDGFIHCRRGPGGRDLAALPGRPICSSPSIRPRSRARASRSPAAAALSAPLRRALVRSRATSGLRRDRVDVRMVWDPARITPQPWQSVLAFYRYVEERNHDFRPLRPPGRARRLRSRTPRRSPGRRLERRCSWPSMPRPTGSTTRCASTSTSAGRFASRFPPHRSSRPASFECEGDVVSGIRIASSQGEMDRTVAPHRGAPARRFNASRAGSRAAPCAIATCSARGRGATRRPSFLR